MQQFSFYFLVCVDWPTGWTTVQNALLFINVEGTCCLLVIHLRALVCTRGSTLNRQNSLITPLEYTLLPRRPTQPYIVTHSRCTHWSVSWLMAHGYAVIWNGGRGRPEHKMNLCRNMHWSLSVFVREFLQQIRSARTLHNFIFRFAANTLFPSNNIPSSRFLAARAVGHGGFA